MRKQSYSKSFFESLLLPWKHVYVFPKGKGIDERKGRGNPN